MTIMEKPTGKSRAKKRNRIEKAVFPALIEVPTSNEASLIDSEVLTRRMLRELDRSADGWIVVTRRHGTGAAISRRS